MQLFLAKTPKIGGSSRIEFLGAKNEVPMAGNLVFQIETPLEIKYNLDSDNRNPS